MMQKACLKLNYLPTHVSYAYNVFDLTDRLDTYTSSNVSLVHSFKLRVYSKHLQYAIQL